MNPGGPVEEVGQTARGLIDALKGQPAVLALTIANFALLVFIFYALHSAAKYRETLISQVLSNSARIHELMQSRSMPCPDRTRAGPTLPAHPIDEKPPPVEDDPPKPSTSGGQQ
jgi:hypothetical protein